MALSLGRLNIEGLCIDFVNIWGGGGGEPGCELHKMLGSVTGNYLY